MKGYMVHSIPQSQTQKNELDFEARTKNIQISSSVNKPFFCYLNNLFKTCLLFIGIASKTNNTRV